MNRFSRPAIKHARTAGGSRQTLIAIAAVGGVLALAGAATNEYMTAVKRDAAGDTYRASKDDDIYTGSILYMPDASNLCHQWLFDNQSGRFADNGSVDCESAYQGFDGPKRWSAARVKVISDGFRDR
ncbi:MAG TPA: hypothetical protein VHX43_01620 [Xanthobacteraceae bacterium]|jgi:hypothetical protein|nr:hypothetical protein [Xanthobacteraceae bacterium]